MKTAWGMFWRAFALAGILVATFFVAIAEGPDAAESFYLYSLEWRS